MGHFNNSGLPIYVTLGENGQIFFINKGTDPYHNCCVKTKLKTLMIPGP